MYDDKRCQKVSELLEQASSLDSKKQKHYKISVLQKYKDRLCRFNELNEKEMNKLILLLEYTIISAIEEDDITYKQRFRLLRCHSIKHFGVCPEGDLRCKCVVEGVSVGIILGVVLSVLIGNPLIGIPIGVVFGITTGIYIAHIDVEVAKREDRLL